MKRILSAAVFSAAFCVLSASVYFTVYFALLSHRAIGIRNLAIGFLYVSTLAALPAAAFGFVLGLLGGWILPHLPFVRQARGRLVVAAAILGGVLGCVPPVIPRIFAPPSKGDITLSFVPSVVIGIGCASLWAFWFQDVFGNQRKVPHDSGT